jgi:drug/metabolite transporter (DMT)-like permease
MQVQIVLLITAIFIGSSFGIVVRLSGLPVFVLIPYAFLVSSLASGGLIVFSNLRGFFTNYKSIIPLIILTPVALANTLTFSYAYKYTTIANAVVTHYTAPIFVAIFSPLLLRERFQRETLLPAVIAIAGLWIMLGFSAREFVHSLLQGDKNTFGIVMGLLSGVAYAFMIIISRKLSISYHPVIITFVRSFLTVMILMPFANISHDINIYAVVIMGVVHLTIGPILFFHGMKGVTAQTGAVIGYLEPVFSIALGMLFLREYIDFQTTVGAMLVLLAGYQTIRSNNCGPG